MYRIDLSLSYNRNRTILSCTLDCYLSLYKTKMYCALFIGRIVNKKNSTSLNEKCSDKLSMT